MSYKRHNVKHERQFIARPFDLKHKTAVLIHIKHFIGRNFNLNPHIFRQSWYKNILYLPVKNLPVIKYKLDLYGHRRRMQTSCLTMRYKADKKKTTVGQLQLFQDCLLLVSKYPAPKCASTTHQCTLSTKRKLSFKVFCPCCDGEISCPSLV